MLPKAGRPAIGSVVSKFQGPVDKSVPPFVGLAPKAGHPPYGSPGLPGCLGAPQAAFRPAGEGMSDLTLNEISPARLNDRKSLLASFDHFRRDVDNSGLVEGLDAFHQQAFAMLTSSRLAEALDLNKEDQKLRDRYGRGFPNLKDDGSHRLLDDFLMARRLVEAGVRCVTIAFSRWDWHGNNFGQAREEFPLLDKGLSALIEDLHARGLDRDVSVVVWGEFGRTPKVNERAGRDHWPKVFSIVMAGGGVKRGYIHGSSDAQGAEPENDPLTVSNYSATVYSLIGIDPERRLMSPGSRPRPKKENLEPRMRTKPRTASTTPAMIRIFPSCNGALGSKETPHPHHDTPAAR